jgi:glutathione S-transferase
VLKPTTAFGSTPYLELPGHPVLGQSSAILVFIGRRWGIHPKDDFEAARHEAILQYCEDLRANVSPTLRMTGEEKKTAHEALASTYLPTWGGHVEKQITSGGPFFGGASLNVVDIKLHIIVRWLGAETADYIPKTIFDAFPKLTRIHDAVRDDARVQAWYTKR